MSELQKKVEILKKQNERLRARNVGALSELKKMMVQSKKQRAVKAAPKQLKPSAKSLKKKNSKNMSRIKMLKDLNKAGLRKLSKSMKPVRIPGVRKMKKVNAASKLKILSEFDVSTLSKN